MSDTPGGINIKDYGYDLPNERIAKFPLEERDLSKLLVYKGGNISTHIFKEIDTCIPENSLLIFNNTKVIHARMLFQKETGAQIEIFCLEPAGHADYQLTFANKGTCSWTCMIGNAKRWKEEVLEKKIHTASGMIILKAEKLAKHADSFEVKFSWEPASMSFSEVLHEGGVLPIPPYLHRDSTEADEVRYQTVYAKEQGSVAAPTAGLHFTENVMEQLRKKHIRQEFVTLHVGAGTFKPVKTETIADHEMHEERVVIHRNTLQVLADTLAQQQTVIAVGTTSARTLESLYWYGVKLITQTPDATAFSIAQWDPYTLPDQDIPATEAINSIINYLDKHELDELKGATRIMIAPGYTFRIIKGLVTNFHQPESTLMLLIAAFTGNNWKRIYDHALIHDFRFLSYGDSSLLLQ